MKFSSVFSAISDFLHSILFYTIFFVKVVVANPPDFFVLIIST